eukprot:1737805-Prymnesium_polylepis.1
MQGGIFRQSHVVGCFVMGQLAIPSVSAKVAAVTSVTHARGARVRSATTIMQRVQLKRAARSI